MTLPLTPAMLVAAYDFLATTPPFNGWGLPEGEEIVFKVVRTKRQFAWYQRDGKRHTIAVSAGKVTSSHMLLQALAHEICHLHLAELGMDNRGTVDTHNGAFRNLAAEVCKFHLWDLAAFY